MNESMPQQFEQLKWEPKHKIFLSHSGAQKAFTEHLCAELERVQHFPFFDSCRDCLPEGEEFYPLIMEAVRNGRVMILVLSEDFFTKSKWPMMELNEFVKAHKSSNTNSKILPIFYGITLDQFKANQVRWRKEWEVMQSKDGRIVLTDWEEAFLIIKKVRGIIRRTEGELDFINQVVTAVCQLEPPDVTWDVSHVQSMNQLCEPILKKLKEKQYMEDSQSNNARVVGLYGMGGVGKTTISRAICRVKFGEFGGKVCHVDVGNMNAKDLSKTILRDLTNASPTILSNEDSKLDDLLKKRMHRQMVFLVLDNVWDNQIEGVQKYLHFEYKAGSMVLVISRSLELIKHFNIQECDCIEMPMLDHNGAIDVFLHYARTSRKFIEKDEWKTIETCIKECYFLTQERQLASTYRKESIYEYHPLALKVLGSQLASITSKISEWEISLKKLQADKFNMLLYKSHPVFSVLRLGYDALCIEEQHIFLDLALLWVSKWRSKYSDILRYEWDWLCTIYRKTKDDMEKSINALQRMGLLEKVNQIEKLDYFIHDLYIEFAKEEVRTGPFKKRRFLLDKDGSEVPHELLKYPHGLCWASLERLIIHGSKVYSLKKAKLDLCRNVEILDLSGCRNLQEVDVTGMDNLRMVIVDECEYCDQWIGIEKLNNLIILNWTGCGTRMHTIFLHHMSLLTALEVLILKNIDFSEKDIFLLDLYQCTNLREIVIFNISNSKRTSTSNLSNLLPKSLLKIHLSNCPFFLEHSSCCSMTTLTRLETLILEHCYNIGDLTAISELTSLQLLRIFVSENVFKLPDLRKLTQLRVLEVCACYDLTTTAGIAHATALQEVDFSQCYNLTELPDDLNDLKNLKKATFEECYVICKLPKDFERLVSRNILYVSQCLNLMMPLVKILQQPKRIYDSSSYIDFHAISSKCEQSMQSWIATKKHKNYMAYNLLTNIISDAFICETVFSSFLDDGDRVDVVIRALCEHDDRGGNRLANVLEEVLSIGDKFQWWTILLNAPCTFRILTKKSILQPWNKTLFHNMIVDVLPQFLYLLCYQRLNWQLMWTKNAINILLQKCKENIEEAIEQDIYPLCNSATKEVVNTLLAELEANNGQKINERCILWIYIGTFGGGEMKYCHLYPNFPFKGYLRFFSNEYSNEDGESFLNMMLKKNIRRRMKMRKRMRMLKEEDEEVDDGMNDDGEDEEDDDDDDNNDNI